MRDSGAAAKPTGARRSVYLCGAPTTTSYTYNAADQLLTEDGVSHTYDLAGRLTSKTDIPGTTTYQYDVENRLVRVIAPAGTTTYAYDADGNRVEKTDATGTVRYLVDPNRDLAQVLGEYTPVGTLIASYVYADNLLSLIRDGQTAFYHADGLGSSRLLTEVSGALTDTYDYEAFGTLVARTGTTENGFLFTGQQADAAQGLYYLRARYYEPRTGRFISRDPVDGDPFAPITLPTYVYAGCDPVNKSDPSGLVFICTSSNTAWGDKVHKTIGKHFEDGNRDPGRPTRLYSRAIADFLGAGPRLAPDLTDLETAGVWEIKTVPEALIGWAKLQIYLRLLKRYDPQKRNWHGGSASEYHYPDGPIRLGVGVEAYVFPPEAGLMLYCPVDWGSTIAALSGAAVAMRTYLKHMIQLAPILRLAWGH